MKLIHSDFKKGTVKLQVTVPEDFWYLSQIIEAGDLLSGKTVRKVTIGSAESKTAHVQKPVFLQIKVESLEFTHGVTALRVSGKITDGPEDVPRGNYHTITLELNSEYTLQKEEWLTYHRSQLKEAATVSAQVLLICILDRDEAILALSRRWGIEVLTKIRGDPEKKEKRSHSKSTMYDDLTQLITSANIRYNPSSIIIASPAFYKDELAKLMKEPPIKKKLVLATCSSVSENAFQEVLKRPETKHATQQMHIAEEEAAVDRLLMALAKSNKATYGFDHVRKAADAGAVAELLITNEFITSKQRAGTFKDVNNLLKTVENLDGKLHIISTDHEAGKKIQGLGGIAAVLRYNLEII
jgi:protein pelota